MSRCQDIGPVPQLLHWLPLYFCIIFKILFLTFRSLRGLVPSSLNAVLDADTPSHTVRSPSASLLSAPPALMVTKCKLNLSSVQILIKALVVALTGDCCKIHR